MCCFEDSASHPQAKVVNGREDEKWAISNFSPPPSPHPPFFFICLLALDAFLHSLMEGQDH